MGCSSRTRTRSARPIRSRAVAGARSIVRRRPLVLRRRNRYAPGGRPGTCGPLCVDRSLRAAARRAARSRPPACDATAGEPWSFADDNSIVDREVAYRAGIGWFGKNANILLPGAGSWFVLGCVITTAPLPTAARRCADGCGSCRRCIDACPTGAIIAPGVIDAGRCLAWIIQKPGVMDRRWRGRGRRSHLRMRRLPDGVPANGSIRRHSIRPRDRPRALGLADRVARRDRCRGHAAVGALVRGGSRSSLGTSQRARRAGQRRQRRDADVRRCLLPLPRPRRPGAAGARGMGGTPPRARRVAPADDTDPLVVEELAASQ